MTTRKALLAFVIVLLALFVLALILPVKAHGQTKPWVTGYYPIWSYCSMSPSDVDFSTITHVIIFTADPDTATYPYFSPVTKPGDSSSIEWGTPNPNCTPQGKWGKPAGYSYLRWMNDSAHTHGAKTLLCLGGIYGPGRDKMAWIGRDSVKTQAWANAAIAYVKRKGMDGVDLDWEYPAGSTSGYMRMLRILRRQLNTMSPPGVLAIAAPAWTDNTAYDFGTIGSLVDQINIMSYDFSGGSQAWFNSGIGNNTPLYPGTSGWWNWNNHGARQWMAKGVPAAKLSMGIPFYSWKFTGPTKPTDPIGGRSYGTYADAVNAIATYGSGIYHWDDSARAPWIAYTSGGTNYFITYQDTNAVKADVKWSMDQQLGGVMLYELWAGWLSNAPSGQRDPLLKAVKRALPVSSIPAPLPAPTIDTTYMKAMAYASGYKDGRASVICPPQIDTAGLASKYFKLGVASVDSLAPARRLWDAIPATVSTQKPPRP
jgi:chitinase